MNENNIHPTAMLDSPGNIVLEGDATIRCGAILRPEGGAIVVHAGAVIGAYCVIHGKGGVEIGKDTMLSPHVQIYAQNHTFATSKIPIKEQPNVGKGVYIMDDCWIGAGSIILDNVTLGKGCVVGAGSVVTKPFPMGSVVMGVPATLRYNRFDGEWNFEESERLHRMAPKEYRNYAQGRYKWAESMIPPITRVLDVGCGDGYLTQRLALAGFEREVIGVDYTLSALHDYELGAASFVRMNSTYLDFPDESFDYIVFMEVLEHLMPYQAIATMSHLRRILKQGGSVIGTTPLNHGRYQTYAHIHEYTLEEFQALILITFPKDEVKVLGDQFIIVKVGV
jgi:acetyltransferase-like isoleucine patch superfamily enzyme